MPEYILKHGQKRRWANLLGSGAGYAISQIIKNSCCPILLVTESQADLRRIASELNFYAQDIPILIFPDWEILPYDHFSPHKDIISERIATLYQLTKLKQVIVLVSAPTLLHRSCPAEHVYQNSLLMQVNEELNLGEFSQQLIKNSYYHVPQVRIHGEFSIRGSIIDIFPAGADLPYRIELFDDSIESIRSFAPATQKSIEKLSEIKILPAREFPFNPDGIAKFKENWLENFGDDYFNCSVYREVNKKVLPAGIEYYLPLFFDHTASLFDYLPENSIIINLGDLHSSTQKFWADVNDRYAQFSHDLSRPILPPAKLFLRSEDFFGQIKKFANFQLSDKYQENADYNWEFIELPDLAIDSKAASPFFKLINFIEKTELRILLCAESAGRQLTLIKQFHNYGISPQKVSGWDEFIASKHKLAITITGLPSGIILSDLQIGLITEHELYPGHQVVLQEIRKASGRDLDLVIKDLSELNSGDLVVHLEHGIGKYLGLENLDLETGNHEQLTEFVVLEYARGDKLYVPIFHLNLLSRYTGADPQNVELSTLGSKNWENAKRKALKKISDVAVELLGIYAKRAAKTGISFEPPGEDYYSFIARFPFDTTPDQQQAIDQVTTDMLAPHPMDRLICGDVGFGKTEVALRAAFLAIQSGYQVAILTPTTLLAQQHYSTFTDRFAECGTRIELLSRFRTGKEQEEVIKKLSNGQVDIIIGTHKLLQAEIKFSNLGLLIIDEEHRFGVKQKDRFKQLRAELDILALTATPIPRTLNMAFAGIRDLSIISTPPKSRLAIKTFVKNENDYLMQEAIRRELSRAGQVYIINNDIKGIAKLAEKIARLVPEAKITTAHGQMRERELEQIMSDFYHCRYNVLICTTIIETGIDIPTANTIIINRADKFGLAQLHQLRGRVGRSHHQAYAYLFVPDLELVTKDANKRLQAIAELEDLGSGFILATHDLEIRGAGELLGEEQSGSIEGIGFSLYLEYLNQAVESLKQGQILSFEDQDLLRKGCEIDLKIPCLIPHDYLNDLHQRLVLYQRITSCSKLTELDDLEMEIRDRFGRLPEELNNLLASCKIKIRAKELGLTKITATLSGGKFYFTTQPKINFSKLIILIQTQPKTYQLKGSSQLNFNYNLTAPAAVIAKINELLDILAE